MCFTRLHFTAFALSRYFCVFAIRNESRNNWLKCSYCNVLKHWLGNTEGTGILGICYFHMPLDRDKFVQGDKTYSILFSFVPVLPPYQGTYLHPSCCFLVFVRNGDFWGHISVPFKWNIMYSVFRDVIVPSHMISLFPSLRTMCWKIRGTFPTIPYRTFNSQYYTTGRSTFWDIYGVTGKCLQ